MQVKSMLSMLLPLAFTSVCLAQTKFFPPDGNVGIGVADPQEKLEVNGSIKLGGAAEVKLTHSLNVSSLNPGVTTLAASITGRKWGHFVIDIYGNDAKDAFAVRTDSDKDGVLDNIPFLVNNLGNVGIGTITPADKLSVNGRIRAKEVKVETANWPDYVFHEDYALQSLPELEAYIKRHGRLPGIPSAQEAETEGIDLGEMNRKLLEKVEQLTLHTIAQDKLIKQQSKLIAAQQQEYETLKLWLRDELASIFTLQIQSK
ncbi:hypothetical protein [Parapedobacter tibetensis]|uniref:hypothetical protein n=1 Tax=Parapedobacter tibetensis TaxID=2972951 RepID=UPI00214D686A|nr:hypothetical protein [Parapedobacter tibetensis]